MAGLWAGACAGTGTQIEPAQQPKPTIEVRTLNVQGNDRTYRVVRPPAQAVGKPLPLVLVLHGYGYVAEDAAAVTGFDLVSVQEQAVVVYPNAYNGRWHTGFGDIDDVLFIRTLIDRLEADYQIDPARIYATGYFDGADMTYRLACQLADRIAAVGPVAGTNGASDCRPAHAISVIAFHGTTDGQSRYDGDPGIGVLSFQAEFERWQQLDGCTGSPKVDDSGSLVIKSAANCKDGTGVTYYTLVGGYHEWPRSAAVSATKLIWQFFATKSRA
jgi:polyhydroxybutyrate depolymerase